MISTKSLELREFVPGDWVAVHVFSSDEKTVRYLRWGPNSEEQTRKFIQDSIEYQQDEPRRRFYLAVVLKSGGALIGACSLQVSELDNREGQITYCLNCSYWGKGYATETAEALLEIGFERLGLRRICTTVDRENSTSSRMLEKIGMKLESYSPEHRFLKGKWHDHFRYSILDHEWRQKNPCTLL